MLFRSGFEFPGVRKLKPSYMGPFEVDSMVGNVAVKLNLPS